MTYLEAFRLVIMDINTTLPSNILSMIGVLGNAPLQTTGSPHPSTSLVTNFQQASAGGPGMLYVPHVPTDAEISPAALAAVQNMLGQHMAALVPKMAEVCTQIAGVEVSKQLAPIHGVIESHNTKLTEVSTDLGVLKAERQQYTMNFSVLDAKSNTLMEEIQRLRRKVDRISSGSLASTSQADDDKGGWDGLSLCVFGVKFFEDAGLRAAEMRRVQELICNAVGINPASVVEVSVLTGVKGVGDARTIGLKMKCLSEAVARSIIMKANLIWSELRLGICECLPRNLQPVRRERMELVKLLREKIPGTRWTMWGINIMMNNTFTPDGASPGGHGIWVKRDDIEALKAELAEAGAMEVGNSG